MSGFSQFFKTYRAAFLSGLLIGTSYIPFPPWAVLFCYVPLWISLLKTTNHSENAKKAFYQAWWTQFILTLIGFYWIAFVSHEYGYMPWAAAVLVALLFAAGIHLYIPLSLALGVWARKKWALSDLATLLLFALFLSLGEIFWPSIFPWHLGYTLLWIESPWAQWADVIGFQGLSVVILLLNALIAYLFIRKNLRLSLKMLAILLPFFLLLHFLGLNKKAEWQKGDKVLKVLQIQANIGNQEKYQAERGAGYQQFIADEYFNLTREALKIHPNADLIIWPESAFTDELDSYSLYRLQSAQFVRFVQEIKKPLLTGAYSKDPPGVKKQLYYNSMFLFDEKGQQVSVTYHKTNLLIFGEYIPFGHDFQWLANLNPGGAGFGRGSGPTIIDWGNIKIGAQICYESLYPEFSRELERKGADLIVNLTNDSWFGPTFEPYQHLYMTLARAIETRRPLIRNTNTGISSAILASGEIMQKSPLYKKWFDLYEVKYQSQAPSTFYSRFGAWLPLPLILCVGLILFLGRRKRARV